MKTISAVTAGLIVLGTGRAIAIGAGAIAGSILGGEVAQRN